MSEAAPEVTHAGVEVGWSHNPQPKVSFCLVTRGDVDLDPVLATVPDGWEVVIWNNRERQFDARAYGRFCALFEANGSVVATCDDDVVVPEQTWRELMERWAALDDQRVDGTLPFDGMLRQWAGHLDNGVAVVNWAHGDNPAGLEDVGFTGAGAIFSKQLALDVWRRWWDVYPPSVVADGSMPMAPDAGGLLYESDFVFGVLCPHVDVHLPYVNRFPSHGNRLCDQPWHEKLKYQYTELARKVRDGRA